METEEKKEYLWLRNYPKDISWDKEFPIESVNSLLEKTASMHPNRSAIDFLGKKTTYKELIDTVNKIAKGLQKIGVKKDTKVGIFMPNCNYFVIFYYAILKAGGVVVNYNPLYVEREIINQMDDSETEIMITLDLNVLAEKLTPLLGKTKMRHLILCPVGDALPFPKNWLFKLIKRKEIFHFQPSDLFISYSSLLDNDGVPEKHPLNLLEDVAVLQYTGGTTGIPKGAMLTHANVYSNAQQAVSWFPGFDPEDGTSDNKVLAALPLFHVFAMTAVMNFAIITGSEIVMMFPRFNVDDAVKMIAKHRITFLPAVPTIYNLINQYPNIHRFDLSSIKMCLSGGAGIPVEVQKKFEELTGCKLVEAYGLSETSPAVTSNPVFGDNRVGSIGLPFPGTTIRIVDLHNSNKEVPQGEKGQIAIKGPQVMKGYWKRPEETASVFSDGFLLTGDVGYMDPEGYTYLVDRIKDLIICSGFNVYPRVIEAAIYKHSAVEEVTVIGIPDDKRGETVKAFIKLKKGYSLTQEEMLLFLKDHISPIEMPKEIEFRSELPKTMIGKLSKKELVREEKSRYENQTKS